MSITDKAPAGPGTTPTGAAAGIDRARIEEVLGRTPTGLLVNGAWREAADGGTFEVENPAVMVAHRAMAGSDPSGSATGCEVQAEISSARGGDGWNMPH